MGSLSRVLGKGWHSDGFWPSELLFSDVGRCMGLQVANETGHGNPMLLPSSIVSMIKFYTRKSATMKSKRLHYDIVSQSVAYQA